MGSASTEPPDDECNLLKRAAAGDGQAWQLVVRRCHSRLRRMVALRMDQRLQARVDPSDVLQEVYLEATERLNEYLANPYLPFLIWMRMITGDRINRLQRYHLGTQARDASRDVSLFHVHLPEASSSALAAQLLGDEKPPGEAAIRAEQIARIQDALALLDPLDREVLAMRHFEQLTSPETAQALGITAAAAAKRYLRAVQKVKDALAQMPGGLDGFLP